jgi:hypothetical protein
MSNADFVNVDMQALVVSMGLVLDTLNAGI